MPSAGVANSAQGVRISIEIAGMCLEPTRRVVGVLNLDELPPMFLASMRLGRRHRGAFPTKRLNARRHLAAIPAVD